MQNHHALLKKLKQQVKLLTQRESQAKEKLRSVMKKMEAMSKQYKHKLHEAKAHGYVNAAYEIERYLLKGVERNARAVAQAAAKIEKKAAAKLKKKK